MHVQPDSLEFYSLPSGERVKDSKALSLTLKELVTDMQTHDHYVTRQRGELPVSTRVLPELVESSHKGNAALFIHWWVQ